MDAPLLATRLQIPPRSPHLVHRARLVTMLERGAIDDGARLMLVSAPAGYGKTTLLAEWARASHARIAWLSLSEEDNEPERFFRGLLAAWTRVQPGIGASRLGLLLGSREPNQEAVLTAFINAGNDLAGHTVFVLDDAHLIENAAISDALAFLLDNLPPMMHIVLAGRREPPLPLARYRARRELLDIGPGDLQFRVEETAEFLNRLLPLGLTGDEIAALHAQLEGWIAGLQLASLTLRHERAAGAPPASLSGHHRFIADYLSDDVLAHLPVETRDFLLQTSILDRLCGPLSEAVTEEAGGQAMLELLVRENLFLMPLDDNREWFRYHRLFADVLRGALQRDRPGDVAALHCRAARWHLDHDMPEQGFHHALAGRDAPTAVEIIERHAGVNLFRGEVNVVRRWIAALPDEWYARHPELGLTRAALLFFMGQPDACARTLDEVERLAITARMERRGPFARVTAMRCFIACYHNDLETAKLLAQQALRELPDEDLTFRGGVHVSLGDTYRLNGYWRESRASYLSALEFVHSPVVRIESVHVYGALADLDLRQGRLRAAAAHWSTALEVIQDQATWGSYPLPEIGWVYLRIAELLYERDTLDDAWDHLRRGLERAELGGDARALLAGNLMSCRMRLTAGENEAAAAALEQARQALARAPFPEWTGRFERMQLELWLAQGRTREAIDWANALLDEGTPDQRPDWDVARLALARAWIARGDRPSLEQAGILLDGLRPEVAADGRMGIEIEASALQALARWQGGDRAGALTALEHALRLAEPEGYLRLFIDLGLPMVRLLQEARSRKVMPDYVARLLAASGGAAPTGATPEPLSPRESDVLRLLAAGLTNREIAVALAVSPETVKKHGASIYGKLGVRNRTEAAARARELDLLGT